MAGVPEYGDAKVGLSGGSTGSLQTPPLEGLDNAGKTLSAAGDTLMQQGEAMGQIAVKEQERANRIAVMEAENELRERRLDLSTGESGYASIKGRDVKGREKPLADEYGEAFGKTADDISSALSNEAQRAMFRERALAIGTRFKEEVATHEFNEYRGWERSVFKGTVALAGEEISANAGDAEAVGDSLERMKIATEELGTFEGMSAEEIEMAVRNNQSGALALGMAAAMDGGDYATAEALFDRYKDDLTTSDRAKIEGPLLREREGVIAMDVVDQAINGVVDAEADPMVDGAPLPPSTTSEGAISYTHPLGTHIGPTVQGGEFGAARDGGTRAHNGRDYAVPVGTDVVGPGDGEVLKVWRSGAGGLQMRVRLADGSVHGFAHLSRAHFKEGQRFRMGQALADSGDTGSGGPHLHYTVTVGGKKIDPKAYKPGGVDEGAATSFAQASRAPAASRAQAWSRARDLLVARYDGNPPTSAIKAARTEFDYQWRIREDEKAEHEEQAMGAVYTALIENGGSYSGLPSEVRRSIPPEMVDDAMGFAIRINSTLKGERDDSEDFSRYNWAVTNPGDLRDMSESSFVKTFADHPNRVALANYRAELRGGKGGGENKAGSIDYSTANNLIDQSLTAIGVDPDEDGNETRVGAARVVVHDAIASAQQRLGRPLNDVEMPQLVRQRFAQQTTMKGGWFADTKNRPIFSIEVGEIDSDRLDLIDAALERAGLPKTEQNRLEMYYRSGGRK